MECHLEQLGEVRQAKVIYNVIGSRLEIAENQEDIAKAFEGVSEDLGYKDIFLKKYKIVIPLFQNQNLK